MNFGVSCSSEDSLIAASDTIRSELVPIPDDGSDVCPMCRSWRHSRFDYCSNCLQAQGELSKPCYRVVPVTLYRRPSLMRDWLKYYKPGADEYHPEYGKFISTIIQRFIYENRLHLVSKLGDYNVVCTVPSSFRPGPHPLSEIADVPSVFGAPVVPLLERGSGELGHRIMGDEAFITRRAVSGDRILLIDDVYTTGARAQSAASALQLAGALVVGVFVVARRIDPDFNLTSQALWARQSAIAYDFATALSWLH
jgi:hypothetical protein